MCHVHMCVRTSVCMCVYAYMQLMHSHGEEEGTLFYSVTCASVRTWMGCQGGLGWRGSWELVREVNQSLAAQGRSCGC